MKIEYPEKKEPVKKAPKIKKKKVVVKKKVVTTAKPDVKWLSPRKATIKRRAPAKPKPIPLKTTVAKKTSTTSAKRTTSVKTSLAPMKGPNYVVSLSSYKERSKATALAKKLTADGYNAYVTEIVSKGTRWYRVRCGFFAGYTEAVRVKDKLSKIYFAKGAWVDKPSKAEVDKFAK